MIKHCSINPYDTAMNLPIRLTTNNLATNKLFTKPSTKTPAKFSSRFSLAAWCINFIYQTKTLASRSIKQVSIIAALLLSLSGCATAIVAGVAIATIDIIHDRRTAGEYIDDAGIEFAAKNVVANNKEYSEAVHLKAQSWNGILLLTGEIKTPEIKQELIPKLQALRGVRQIVDETTINDKSKFNTIANDTWISSKVKSRLILKTGLKANRVKVVTTRGSVYLMGIVTREEADKATEHASNVKGVKRVVRVFEYQESKTQ